MGGRLAGDDAISADVDKTPAIRAAVGAAMGLALAAGLVLQLSGDAGRDTRIGAERDVRSPAAVARSERDAGRAAGGPLRSGMIISADDRPVFLLVDTEEQAEAIRRGVERQAPDAATSAVWPNSATVFVVRSPEDERRVAEVIAAECHLRLASGLPEMRVVDLRAPAGGGAMP